MDISGTVFRIFPSALLLLGISASSAKADNIVVGAPTPSSSFYGMCCTTQISSAAQFSLSLSEYVTAIDVVVLGSNSSKAVYDFSVRNSLTGPGTTFASAVFLVGNPGENTEVIPMGGTLAAGTYYIIGSQDPSDTLPVPGWFVSDGSLVTAAGSVSNGVWSSQNGIAGPWSFTSGVNDGYTYNAPTFAVYGPQAIPEPYGLLPTGAGLLGVALLAARRKRFAHRAFIPRSA